MNKLYQVDLTAEEREAEHKERRLFIDLLSYMLVLDPTKRHSASQLLQHPFITVILSFSFLLYREEMNHMHLLVLL